MAGVQVILARHGQTELNRLGIIQGSGVNPPLNAEGRAQAAALFQQFNGKVDRVLTSGMLRAEQTAAPFVETGLVAETDDRFREICWGQYEGRVAHQAMRDSYHELLQSWERGDLDTRVPGGESARELGERLQTAWDDLITGDFQRALVVMHGRALRCLACLLDGKSLSEMNHYGHANAGYYVVERSGDNWQLVAKNVTTHLTHLKTEA
jgi:probable phosphoglycerate mutase